MISPQYFLKKVKDVRPRDLAAVVPMVAAWAVSPFFKKRNQDTWVVCEDPLEARDNGYWFFKKMRENHPDQSCVYAIDMRSADYERVRDLGEVIPYGGLRHWLLYFTGAHTVSSQKGGKPNAALCAFLELNGLVDSHTVFLQHGVIINDLEWLYADRSRFDMFVTSAAPEFEFVDGTFGYEKGVVRLTGQPRFDGLHDFEVSPGRIVIMPTWRSWFNLKSEQQEGLDGDFLHSRYLEAWRALLESPRLNQLIEDHDLEVIFYPHRNMQRYLEDLKRGLRTKATVASWEDWDIQDLLKTSQLMITDYSSVFFDMIYMKKPVLFYQFDLDDFRKGQYKQGWFDYRDNPFAPSFGEREELLDALEECVSNGFAVTPKYLEAHEACFPYYDSCNTERVRESMLELDGRVDDETEILDEGRNGLIGVVIVNYNTTDELFLCIDSIRNETKRDFKIYVVENGSRAEVRDAVMAHCEPLDDVEVVVSQENLGYSGGNNLGIAQAMQDGARYIAIVNSDVVLVNDALSIMAADITGDVAVAGPRVATLDDDNGQILFKTYSYGEALFDRQPFHSMRSAVDKVLNRSFDYDRRQVFAGMVSGCCFLIDAHVFDELGFFDDNVFLYSEERILSVKLAEAGYKACYEPAAAVIHMEGKTTNESGNAFADYHRYASDYYAVSRYCEASRPQLDVLKALRLAAFRAKAANDDEYRRYYGLLKQTYHSIDHGENKITPFA